jgi:inner membrane protein
MDTTSHVLVGLTLAGLASVDPGTAASGEVARAVLAATVIGSNAPDLDVLVRIRGKAAYIRHHRGVTHSLPLLPLWAAAIGIPLAYAFGVPESVWTIMLWSFVAVVCHVVLDLFNAYGVQCLIPFTRRWLHLDALCLFDPYLFAVHAIAAVGWLTGILPPEPLFVGVYTASLCYIGWRLASRRRAIRRLLGNGYGRSGLALLPSLNGRVWHYVAETSDNYVTGRLDGERIVSGATYPKRWNIDLHPVVKASMDAEGVRAMLHFAERIHVEWKEREEGFEVTWADIRFWYDHRLPFRAAVRLDREMNVIQDQMGWQKKSWEPPYV